MILIKYRFAVISKLRFVIIAVAVPVMSLGGSGIKTCCFQVIVETMVFVAPIFFISLMS